MQYFLEQKYWLKDKDMLLKDAYDDLIKKYNASENDLESSKLWKEWLVAVSEGKKFNKIFEKPEIPSKSLAVSEEEVKNNNVANKVVLKPKGIIKVGETSKNVSEKLENNFLNKVLIGTGRAFVKIGKSIKQFSLGIGEKIGIVKNGAITAYTKKID